MGITVIRHGKVDMRWPRRCNAEEFDNACRRYEKADILQVHAEKKAAAAGEPAVTGKIYVSTQHRSLKTAKALFGEQEYIQMSGLCEVPLRSFAELGFRLPLWSGMWRAGFNGILGADARQKAAEIRSKGRKRLSGCSQKRKIVSL